METETLLRSHAEVLELLSEGFTQAEIAKTINHSRSSISQIVKELNKKKLVSKAIEGNYNIKYNTVPTDELKVFLGDGNNKKIFNLDVVKEMLLTNKKKYKLSEEKKERMKERVYQSKSNLWYGAVKYEREKYCELWTPELRERIRAYWGDKSVLSGKTKEQNGNILLSCHHVYYEKKACCEWDEDTRGYFTHIDGDRFDIKGDPNKFVVLTSAENSMVNRDKKTWIRFFENLIEVQGGKCYFTSDEMQRWQYTNKLEETKPDEQYYKF
jgi:DNA-binding transcriptional regulator GbsR (MarR family)